MKARNRAVLSRILAMMLVLMLALGLSACGGSEKTETEQEPADEAAMAAEEADAAATEETGTEETEPEAAEEELAEAQFPLTVYEGNGVLFQVKGVEHGMFGYTWKAYLENNTDQSLRFTMDGTSICGMMCEPLWVETVEAGKKSNSDISWSDRTLERNGVTRVDNVEFGLRIQDNEDWSADPLVDEIVHVYPYGEENATVLTREPQEGDLVLFENDECRMTVLGWGEDSIWGFGLQVYLENLSDHNLMFAVNDASINGFMCDPFWASTVAAGKAEFSEMNWSDRKLEENGIETIEEIELPITVRDYDHFSQEPVIDETFTVSIE